MQPEVCSGNGYYVITSGSNKAQITLDTPPDDEFRQNFAAAPEVDTIESVTDKRIVFTYASMWIGFDSICRVVESLTRALMKRQGIPNTPTWQLCYMGQSMIEYRSSFRITFGEGFPSNKLRKLLKAEHQLTVAVVWHTMQGGIDAIDITPIEPTCPTSTQSIVHTHELIEKTIRHSLQ